MRNLLVRLSIATFALLGASCSDGLLDTTGTLFGGQSIYDANAPIVESGAGDGAIPPPMCPSGAPPFLPGDGGVPRFADLYTCYFSTCGASNMNGCHQLANDLGTLNSGFVCGMDATSCANGMQSALAPYTIPIVPKGGSPMPAMTTLLGALRGGSPGPGMMPVIPVYTFTPQDIAAIDAWIVAGAPNN